MSLYQGTNRDIDDLEPHYSNHVDAMTTEGLHKKSAIAAELAYRDRRIEELEARVKELERKLRKKDMVIDSLIKDFPDECVICGKDHGGLQCPKLTVTCS